MRLLLILALIIVVGVTVASRVDNLRRHAQWQQLNDFFNRAGAQGENDGGDDGKSDGGNVTALQSAQSVEEKGTDLFGTLRTKGEGGDGPVDANVAGSVPLRSLYESLAINVTLLQSLAERTERLNERERTVEARETVLAALQKKVEEREGALQKTRGEITALLERYEGEQAGGLQQLIGIYSTIEPKRAATIFNELDLDIVVALLRRMPSRRVAPILAAMDAEKARRITLELSE